MPFSHLLCQIHVVYLVSFMNAHRSNLQNPWPRRFFRYPRARQRSNVPGVTSILLMTIWTHFRTWPKIDYYSLVERTASYIDLIMLSYIKLPYRTLEGKWYLYKFHLLCNLFCQQNSDRCTGENALNNYIRVQSRNEHQESNFCRQTHIL